MNTHKPSVLKGVGSLFYQVRLYFVSAVSTT